MKIDQIPWNILFEWITGTRCFIPEGCPPPLAGILFYALIAAMFLASMSLFITRKIIPRIHDTK
jgi:hypothetical protein